MNIGLIAPIPSDGTSLYRAHGPFAYISRQTGANIICDSEWDWTNIMRCNVVVMQRPFTPEHLMVARTCNVLKVPLWVDYDDLYSGFPPWTQVQQDIYMGNQSLEMMRACLSCADVVTVSTEGMRQISPKAVVVPNALNTSVWPFTKAPRQNIVAWRGSGGHTGDLAMVMPQMRRLAETRKDYRWHFFGQPHWECLEFGERHPYRDVWTYMQQFCMTAPAIVVVPLVDIPFNHAKSNNAWLEATAAGAVVVAPNWEQWQRPGIINYASPAHFEATVSAAMNMTAEEREARVEQSRAYIAERLTLDVVNKQRLAILERLTNA